MAPERTPQKVKQFEGRGWGVMKKGNDVATLVDGVKAAVFFLDGKNLKVYESEEGWVSQLSLPDLDVQRYDPLNFTDGHKKKAKQRMDALPTLASSVESLFVPQTLLPAPASPIEGSLFVPQSLPCTPFTSAVIRQPTPNNSVIRSSTASSALNRRRRKPAGGARNLRGGRGAPKKDIFGFSKVTSDNEMEGQE